MTQTRHKTTIEIDVDDRQIVGLERSLGRAFDQKMLDNFERGLERIARSMEKMAGQSPGIPSAGAAGVTGTGGSSRTREDSALVRELRMLRTEVKKTNDESRRAASTGGTAMGTFGGMMGFQLMQRMLGMGPGALGGSATSTALGAIPFIGPTLGAAAQQSVRLYGEYAQQQQAQAAAFGQTGLSGAAANAATRMGVGRFGLAPGMVPGLVSQMAGASGRTGAGLAGSLGTMFDLQQLLGIQAGGGGLLGAAETAGGRVQDTESLLTNAVSAGVTAGFREGRLNQYFQQLSTFVETARTRGIPLDANSAMNFFASMGALGPSFQGEAGAAFASSFGAGFQRAGEGGSVFDAIALRAAGLGSGATLQQARERIESDPAVMSRYLGQIRSMAGGDETLGAMLMRQATGAFGGDLSAVQSRELFESGMPLLTMMGGDGAALLDERRRRGHAGFAAGRFSGGLALQRMGIGARHAGTAQRVQSLDMQVMGAGLAALHPVLNELVGVLGRLTSAFVGGGFAGLTQEAMAIGTEGLGALMQDDQGNPMSAEETGMRALDAVSWAINSGAAELFDALGMDEQARASRSVAERSVDREAARTRARTASTGPGGSGAITPGPTVATPDALRTLGDAAHQTADALESDGGDVTAVR